MIDGYTDSGSQKPDVNWWLQQLSAGEQWRKIQTFETRWNDWRSMYRGDWKPNVMPINLFFSMMNSFVPKVYFRNPTVSISPGVPGRDAMLFARVLQRLDNKMLNQMRVKDHMKRMVRDSFMFGTGIGKLGFGGIFSPGIKPSMASKEKTAYGQLETDVPWFRRLQPDMFVVPEYTTFIDENTRWVAYKHRRMLSDVKADEMFDPRTRKLVTSTVNVESSLTLRTSIPMVDLYEVQDTKTGMTFIMAPGGSSGADGQLLYIGPDEMQSIRHTSAFPLIFNEVDNSFWGVPDSKILEPYQLEINETRTQIAMHRRTSVVKILAKIRGISEEQATKIVSEEVAPIVWTDEAPDQVVKLITGNSIPPELSNHIQTIHQDVREVMGMSRNQMGEFNSRSGDTTATEAQIVSQAMEIRIDERRDICADLLTGITAALHEMMFMSMPDEMVVDMTGPGGGLVWVTLKGDLVKKGRYSINIDPDSGMPLTQDLRQQRAMQSYQFLAMNPFLDPVKVSQYLLSEMVGNQFDDMMRPYDPFTMMMAQQEMQNSPTASMGMPGMSPENPMSTDQYMQGMQQQAAANPQLAKPEKA